MLVFYALDILHRYARVRQRRAESAALDVTVRARGDARGREPAFFIQRYAGEGRDIEEVATPRFCAPTLHYWSGSLLRAARARALGLVHIRDIVLHKRYARDMRDAVYVVERVYFRYYAARAAYDCWR